jgi:hypothetical protein
VIAALLLLGVDTTSFTVCSQIQKLAPEAPVNLTERQGHERCPFAASQAVLPTVVSISVTFESKETNSRYQEQWKDFFEFLASRFKATIPRGEAKATLLALSLPPTVISLQTITLSRTQLQSR